MKNLLVFGLVVLSISFVWIGLKGINRPIETTQAEGINPGETIVEETDKEAIVTIVPEVQNTEETKENFFIEYRIERDRKRSEQIEILREIVNNTNSSAQMREQAQQKLIEISDILEKESKIERALIAKGFKDAVLDIQAEAVMVIVPSNGLRQDEIARISDIVVKVTGRRMEDVVIVPKSQ